MITLGIDPSLSATGCIYIENGKILKQKLIKTKPTSTILGELQRLCEIKENIIIENVSLIVMEGLAMRSFRTTSLIQLAGLNYLLREYFYLLKIPFIVVSPTRLKKYITGKGNSKKELMLLETYRSFNITFKNNNLCDAYGLAIIGDTLLNNRKVNKNRQNIINELKQQYEEQLGKN